MGATGGWTMAYDAAAGEYKTGAIAWHFTIDDITSTFRIGDNNARDPVVIQQAIQHRVEEVTGRFESFGHAEFPMELTGSGESTQNNHTQRARARATCFEDIAAAIPTI